MKECQHQYIIPFENILHHSFHFMTVGFLNVKENKKVTRIMIISFFLKGTDNITSSVISAIDLNTFLRVSVTRLY